VRVDRRTTLKWLAAAMAAANAGCGPDSGDGVPPAGKLLGTAGTPGGAGYGVDPKVVEPSVPWTLTMTEPQLEVASALCDLILPADDTSPAASALGVPDFINEWISAPYPQQQRDRELVLGGLEWLEGQSRARFGRGFAAASEADQMMLADELAWPERGASPPPEMIEFFRRFRFVAVGAYFSTSDGHAYVGYVGNVAIAGEYPGPSEEAMQHLEGVLEKLGLSLDS